MKIVTIISQHKKRRGVKAGHVRVQAILASHKRGHHTRHLDVPKDFSPSKPHQVESVEVKGAERGQPRFQLIVRTA